jgi:hypothetical protein
MSAAQLCFAKLAHQRAQVFVAQCGNIVTGDFKHD